MVYVCVCMVRQLDSRRGPNTFDLLIKITKMRAKLKVSAGAEYIENHI